MNDGKRGSKKDSVGAEIVLDYKDHRVKSMDIAWRTWVLDSERV